MTTTVRISVPDDHIVAATGVLQNPGDVLTEAQRERLDEARDAERPVMVVTKEEAIEAENGSPDGKKTWIFEAENVRDFAFASSRKFLWDALGVEVDGRTVMAMSYWPKEGEPLWSRYSTHAIAHTLDVYGKFTFPYPYPVAISVNGPVGGMEYPMICFNGPRPEEDGTYSARTKYGLISVIIHEVGHNFFPMIVNSDERQWTWMDEGLNTFCQYLAEQEWEEDYPSRRGEPQRIASYLASNNRVPIMTNSESLLQFGNNAYAAPATALNVLRETVMGRELFDFAFAEYSRRWAFKRPMPSDLFRTLEDASAVDLDWFWRGWFYSTDHVDLALAGITQYLLDTEDPDLDKVARRADRDDDPTTLSEARNEGLDRRVERFPELADFYNEFDELDVTEADRTAYQKLIERLEPRELELLATERFFYVIEIENLGGLVMPVIVEVETQDGATAEHRIPAEIWARNDERVKKLLMTESEIVRITLDPHLETADADLSNNAWPREPRTTRFKLFKDKKGSNPMRKAREEEERAKKEAEGGDPEDGDAEGRTMKLVRASIAAVALAAPALAHGFHVSAGEVDLNRESSCLEVAIALSAGDLEIALSRHVGARVRLDGPGAEAICAEYVARTFRLVDPGGRAAPLRWVGWETELFTTWVYFELALDGAGEAPVGSFLENRLLFGVAPEQANTLQLRGGRRPSTTTFTDARPLRRITPELGLAHTARRRPPARGDHGARSARRPGVIGRPSR